MRRRLPIAAALLLGAVAPTVAAAQDRSLEYPVKAAFLLRFGSFVEWPPGGFPAPQTPVQLCVVGRDPFGAELDRLVRGQTINMRPISVRRVGSISAGSGCQIAYLGGSPQQSAAAAARAVAGTPVLTVVDGPDSEPAAIQFLIKANRVRFKIDQRVASASGLSISSKLLNLAVEVTR